uniref:Protein kinase domain-containing protein n=1 Tax=viral metagenome TaxID=1070528 RepID=A0A6C0L9B4_9ZZZZ
MADTLQDALALPLDLRPIGIAASMEESMDETTIDWKAVQTVKWAAGTPIISRRLDLVSNPTLQFADGKEVVLRAYLGTGAYGHVFKGDLGGVPVAIKFEGVGHPKQKEKAYKEIIVHHFIHTATAGTNHEDCSYAGKVYTVGRMEGYISTKGNEPPPGMYPLISDVSVLVMELATGDVLSYLAENNSSEVGTQIAMKIARKLGVLYKLYKYNHCDLHVGNVLVYPDGNMKLADFGMSSILIGSLDLEVAPDFNYMYTRARDMIILLFSMHLCVHIHPCRAALDEIIKNMKDHNIVDNIHALYGEIGNGINIDSCRPAKLLETYNTAGPVNKVQSLFAGRPFHDEPCSSAKPKQGPNSPVIPVSMYSPFTPPESKTAITIAPSRGGRSRSKKVKGKKTIKRR